MPVHNGLPYLREALESLLAQTLAEIEILVLNDGSTDGTTDYLNGVTDSRVRVTHFEKQGYVPLLNYGLQQSQGQFVARMDADDITLPHRLEVQVQFLQENPDVSVVGCQAIEIDAQGKVLGPRKYPTSPTQIFYMLTARPPLLHPGVLISREALNIAGEYHVGYATAEDYDFWWRLGRVGRLANLDQVLVHYRIHPKSVTRSQTQQQEQFAYEICCKHLTEQGFATTPQEASDYFSCHRHLFAMQHTHTLEQWTNFLGVFERVAVHAQCNCADATEEIPKLRQQIRWALLAHGKQLGSTLAERWRLFQLACQVDPEEMRLRRIAYRMGRKLLGEQRFVKPRL